MKKLLLLWLALTSALATYAQTPEQVVRTRISAIRGVKLNLIPNFGLSNAFTALADMSAKRIPYVTRVELRSGKADTARAVVVIDQVARGVYYYDPVSSAEDDGVSVIVAGARRYIKEAPPVPAVIPQANVQNLSSDLATKQPLLTPGVNIVNINGNPLTGTGNIALATPDASSITSGTLSDARLSTAITRNSSNQTLTNKSISGATNTITSIPESAIPTLATTIANAIATRMPTFTPTTINGVSATAGTALTLATTSAASLVSGTLDDARLSANIVKTTVAAALTNKTLDGDLNTILDLPQTATKFLSDSLLIKANIGRLAKINGQSLYNGGANITITGGTGTDPATIQTAISNDQAIAGGVQPTTYFKTVADEEYVIRLAKPAPNFTEFLNTSNTRTFWSGTPYQQQWFAHNGSVSGSKPYAATRASNRHGSYMRFEVRPGDQWPGDQPDPDPVTGIRPTPTAANSNYQNGQVKERSEVYQDNVNMPYDKDIWCSYSMYIEPGDANNIMDPIVYNNLNDFVCYVGQWHGTGDGGPTWGFALNEYGRIRLMTRGYGTVNTTGNPPSVPGNYVATATVQRGKWNHFVVRVRHNGSVTGDKTLDTDGKTWLGGTRKGQIEWWLNGVKQYENNAIAIGYNDTYSGYWKFGIYRTAASSAINPETGRSSKVTTAIRYANMKFIVDDLNNGVKTLRDKILNPDPIE